MDPSSQKSVNTVIILENLVNPKLTTSFEYPILLPFNPNPFFQEESCLHSFQDLIAIFEACFFESHNTRLIEGADEPLYLPSGDERPYASIFFRSDFFASALHECAHWLIAGHERRKLVDFGYWYFPDGREPSRQKMFEAAEVKPQAMEWILSKAAGYRFHISLDNLNGTDFDLQPFQEALYKQITLYCTKGLPKRASTLREALCSFYGTPLLLQIKDFDIH